MTKEIYILYIEDERPMLELVRQALKFSGYNVTGATSGRRGLEMMRTKKPDLVLLDLMMTDINGWDVYRVMKTDEKLANVPVIVITAKIPDHDLLIVDDLPPVNDYITKPFDIKRLLNSVNRLLVDS